MISQLASPSVCVIDDEEEDYRPILKALNELYVSSIHILGSVEGLPPQPFNRLRLIFLDLHLSGMVGKNAASHTANVFTKVVSPDTAPIIVVIWSKYAADKIPVADGPPAEQETEAELFKSMLFEAEANFRGRLIFVEMAKPKKDDRPNDWTEDLKTQIEAVLRDQSAVELLWAWESLIANGCSQVSQELTSVGQTAVAGTGRELKDGIKATMQRLAKAQGEGDFSSSTASKHLLAVLTKLLLDQMEHLEGIAKTSSHGTWLSEDPPGGVGSGFAAHINALLLTATRNVEEGLYVPGTVYWVKNTANFKLAFGSEFSSLIDLCVQKSASKEKKEAWAKVAQPVLIELSPVCDMAQGYRVSSLLVAGVIVPSTCRKYAKLTGEAFGALPDFKLRWPGPPAFAEQDVTLMYCHRYKVTLPAGAAPDWLEPWFRLRDLPLAAIRNSNAAHAARVGYVSVTDF